MSKTHTYSHGFGLDYSLFNHVTGTIFVVAVVGIVGFVYANTEEGKAFQKSIENLEIFAPQEFQFTALDPIFTIKEETTPSPTVQPTVTPTVTPTALPTRVPTKVIKQPTPTLIPVKPTASTQKASDEWFAKVQEENRKKQEQWKKETEQFRLNSQKSLEEFKKQAEADMEAFKKAHGIN